MKTTSQKINPEKQSEYLEIQDMATQTSGLEGFDNYKSRDVGADFNNSDDVVTSELAEDISDLRTSRMGLSEGFAKNNHGMGTPNYTTTPNNDIMSFVSNNKVLLTIIGGVAVGIVIAGMSGNERVKSLLSGVKSFAGDLTNQIKDRFLSENISEVVKQLTKKTAEAATS